MADRARKWFRPFAVFGALVFAARGLFYGEVLTAAGETASAYTVYVIDAVAVVVFIVLAIRGPRRT